MGWVLKPASTTGEDKCQLSNLEGRVYGGINQRTNNFQDRKIKWRLGVWLASKKCWVPSTATRKERGRMGRGEEKACSKQVTNPRVRGLGDQKGKRKEEG